MTRELDLSGYVGFDSLPHQIVKRCLQENFAFNILCVGETGIGKSTLISSLFNMEIDTSRSRKHTNSAVSLKTRKYYIKEKEVPLRLSVTETVGYGDQINKEGNFEPIVNYVDSQFEKYLQEELKIIRNLTGYRDTRIHVCLYLVCPTGHTLKASDLLALKYLSSKVNVVPLIAKADTLTKAELQDFKSNIRKEIQREKIEIYQFQSEDETKSELKVIDDVPFAVVGSTDVVVNDGKLTRGRNYLWGTVYIDNEDHSDFVKLRQLLIEIHMEDLTSLTHTRHYQNYRKERLKQCGFEDFQLGDGQLNLMEILDAKAEEMHLHFQAEEEKMAQCFIERVKNTEQELAEEEQRIKLNYRTLQDQNENEQRILDEEKKLLLQEIDLFHKKKREFEQRKKCQQE
ncbi:Septin-2 [Araneus ventricosus]|uniref:Septin n=1 Tax=Araneus ventricosus TaxID=182803 RepID=A0A4Y2HSJ2_ARAVE|nr:Septin-2 [Araneus ventricosus]